MFASPTYHQMAVQLVHKIITDGKNIYFETDKNNMAVIASLKKDGLFRVANVEFSESDGMNVGAEAKILHEGMDPTRAAIFYVNTIGAFNAIGCAIKIFREKEKVITAPSDNV